jgi:hydroxymethylglutaryl-CoA lyase
MTVQQTLPVSVIATAPTAADRAVPPAPDRVDVVEVAARDGLQSEPTVLPTAVKVDLIGRAVRAGLRRVEAVSFVNPDRVPQMADAEAVMAALHADPELGSMDPSFIGLVLNPRGIERAVATGVDEVNSVVVCTDTFARRNQGRDTAGLIEGSAAVVAAARSAGIGSSVTLTAAFGCPYEGEVGEDRLTWVLEQVLASAPDEIALADSIGSAVPADVRRRVSLARDVVADRPTVLRCHFHNTRNTGLANALAAAESGVRVLDAALGGIGGCPFAPNATGNIPTEDLLYLLHRSGWSTGVDLAAACDVVPWLERVLDHPAPGFLSKAGIFPDNARGRVS